MAKDCYSNRPRRIHEAGQHISRVHRSHGRGAGAGKLLGRRCQRPRHTILPDAFEEAGARLNNARGVFEYEVDAAGNTTAKVWEVEVRLRRPRLGEGWPGRLVESYCFSSTNVETLPNRLLSETVVICFPSAETVILSTLSNLPSRRKVASI